MNIELLEAEIYENETKCLKLKAFTAVISDDHVITSGFGKDEFLQLNNTDSVVHWDVEFVNTGQLDFAINLGADEDNVGSEVEIEVDDEKMIAVLPSTGGIDESTTVKLGSIYLTKTGCFSVKMKANSIKGDEAGKVWYLELSGPAAVDSTEDMLPRSANDVFLNWIIEDECDLLYCAFTPVESHMGTEFMPIQFDLCYLSLIHYDSGGNRCTNCISFSYDEDLFEVIHRASFFLQDAPGLIFPWEMKETFHFLVKVVPSPDEDALLYLGYLYFNHESKWKIIMVLKRPNCKTLLKEFKSVVHSLNSDHMGYFPREAAFGPVWGRLPNGEWKEILACDYTKSGTLFNTDAFVSDNRVHLRTGGRTVQTNNLGTVFNLEPSGELPEVLEDIDTQLEGIPSNPSG